MEEILRHYNPEIKIGDRFIINKEHDTAWGYPFIRGYDPRGLDFPIQIKVKEVHTIEKFKQTFIKDERGYSFLYTSLFKKVYVTKINIYR